MDAPSLRQFQLDLAANRTKKALVIDQRFNGGGGIEQELLQILSGRAVPVHRRPRCRRPSAAPAELLRADGRDAERAIGIERRDVPGRVPGARSRQGDRRADRWAAVIGTGSYTLLDGSTIRTPGTGVWIADTGENMENFGVPPDVYVDNTPADHLKKRDAQIEKAVEVLREELTKKPQSGGGAQGR